jgi:3-oxoacyl-[acyl-carrier protein] reductase
MTIPHPFAGKVAIVTGASRGIGKAIALRLAAGGATLVLAARTAEHLDAVAGEIKAGGALATTFPADLRDPAVPAALARTAIEAHGAIDIIVNNAGAAKRGDLLDLTEADWTDGFALKFFGAVRLSRAAWPKLVERKGSVLNIIGVGGRTPGADFTLPGSVNGAFLSFTKGLAQMGIRDGVQVNALNPGPVRTDRLNATIASLQREQGGSWEDAAARFLEGSSIVRIGEPEDIAALAAFVLSPEGRLLQGSLIDIDGGQTKTI